MLQRSYQSSILPRPAAKRLIRAALLTLLIGATATAQQGPGVAGDPNQAASRDTPADTTVDPADPAWQTNLTFYLWFPGVHGIAGADGHDVGFRASPGDLLSHFRFGLMG